MNIGDIFWRLGIDDDDFGVSIVKSAKAAGTKGGQTLGQSLTASFKKAWSKDELGKGLVQGFGLAGALGIANLTQKAISGVVDVIGDSIDAARDLNETMSKSRVVFGDAADEVDAWGDQTADSLGISKNAAIAAAAGFGDLFGKMDETRGASREMSTELVELAADIASFQNLDPAEVLEKLRAGLAGEAEPLRRVGVFLTEAKVQAKALALGFKPLNGRLSEGAKIAARYALIMEETATAQGDFARTSDGLANKQRILDAKMADAAATLGQKLLPVALALTEAGIGLVDVLDDLAPAFDALAAAADIAGRAMGVTATDGLKKLQEGHDRAQQTAKPFWELMFNAPPEATERIESFATHSYDAVEATRAQFEFGGKKIEGALEGVAEESELTEQTVGRSLDGMVDHFNDAISDLESAATEAGDAMFDPIDDRAELSRINREQAAIQAEIAEVRAAGKSVTEQTQKWRDLERERLRTIARLAGAGAASEAELNSELRDLIRLMERATGRERAAIQALIRELNMAAIKAQLVRNRIAGIQFLPGFGGPGAGGRASGGPMAAGRPYIVGERGQELIVPAEDKHVYDAFATGDMLKAAVALAGVTSALGSGLQASAPSIPSIAPSLRSAALPTTPVATGGTTYAVSLNSPLPLRSPREVVTELRRITTLHEVPSRRVPPLYPVEALE